MSFQYLGQSPWVMGNPQDTGWLCVYVTAMLHSSLCSSSGTGDVKGLQLLLGTHKTVGLINRPRSDQIRPGTASHWPKYKLTSVSPDSTEVWWNEHSVLKCTDVPCVCTKVRETGCGGITWRSCTMVDNGYFFLLNLEIFWFLTQFLLREAQTFLETFWKLKELQWALNPAPQSIRGTIKKFWDCAYNRQKPYLI